MNAADYKRATIYQFIGNIRHCNAQLSFVTEPADIERIKAQISYMENRIEELEDELERLDEE